MRRRAAVYTRISRDKVGAGLGVERQGTDCRKLAADLGWQVVEPVYTDNDLSAYSGKPRPGYRDLLGAIRGGHVDAVLCWHTDRLHRSPAELEAYIGVCEPRGVPTITVTAGPLDLATPSGRLVARQLGAVARYEVEHMVERQQAARLQAATDGRWSGGRRPYGYEADGTTVVEQEAAVLQGVADQVLAGVSLRRISRDLNDRGARTSTGHRWQPKTLRDVLLRPRNAGIMQHRGKEVGPARWPAILDEDTWRGVVAVLTDPTRRTQVTTAPRWLLSRLARCGVCDAPVTATSTSGRPVYACKGGKHVVRDARKVDRLVEAVIVARLSRPDARDLLVPDRRVDTAALHARDAALRERLDGLAVAYAREEIDAAQLRAGTALLRHQRQQVAAELAAATPTRNRALQGVADAPDPAKAWAGLDLERRRAVCSVLVEVVILPVGRRGRRAGWRKGDSYFDPTSVRITPKRG